MKALKEDNYEDKFLFGLDANVIIQDNNDPELLRNRVVQVGDKVVTHEFYGTAEKGVEGQTRTKILQKRKEERL